MKKGKAIEVKTGEVKTGEVKTGEVKTGENTEGGKELVKTIPHDTAEELILNRSNDNAVEKALSEDIEDSIIFLSSQGYIVFPANGGDLEKEMDGLKDVRSDVGVVESVLGQGQDGIEHLFERFNENIEDFGSDKELFLKIEDFRQRFKAISKDESRAGKVRGVARRADNQLSLIMKMMGYPSDFKISSEKEKGSEEEGGEQTVISENDTTDKGTEGADDDNDGSGIV